MNPQALNMAVGPTASPHSTADDSWYLNLGATHHFILVLDMMHSARPFTRGDRVTVGDSKKLSISHIGHASQHLSHASLPTKSFSLSLKNIIHTPNIFNNLISVSKLCHYNQVFVEYHVDQFFVKNQITHQVLLQGYLD